MKRPWVFVAAFAASLFAASIAGAAVPVVSPLALPMAGTEPQLATTVFAASASSDERSGFAQPPPPYESVRYRPRYRPRDRYREPQQRSYGSGPTSYMQIHAGFLDFEGDPGSGVLFGARLAAVPDPHVRVGAMADWRHKSDRQSETISRGSGPGGEPIEIRRELSRSSSNLFPMMGFIEVSADQDMPVIPYFGFGGGYEVLFLSAEDVQTGDQFDATFGGWGWQAWGGVGIPLSGPSRLVGEVFWNESDVEREVDDPVFGRLHEVVNVNGMGARFGFAWGF